MFCTGCGTQSADSDGFCGGCGIANHPATGAAAPSAKRVFNLGAAMRQKAVPGGAKSRPWGAFTLALMALVALCMLIVGT